MFEYFPVGDDVIDVVIVVMVVGAIVLGNEKNQKWLIYTLPGARRTRRAILFCAALLSHLIGWQRPSR